MDGKLLARIGAIVFVTIAITATVIELSRKDETPLYRNVAATTEPSLDPLKGELRRCQHLGEAAIRDSACLKAWADNRDRFLRPSNALPQPAPQNDTQNPPALRDPISSEPTQTTATDANEGR